MSSRTVQTVVHDSTPMRLADLQTEQWAAPATRTPRLTDKERRIVEARQHGADLAQLVRNHALNPHTLFKLLGMNPSEHVEVFTKLLSEFKGLQARALK